MCELGEAFRKSIEVTFFFWQNISNINALLCKVLFLLSKVTKLKVSSTIIGQFLLQPDIILGQREAFTSFMPKKLA